MWIMGSCEDSVWWCLSSAQGSRWHVGLVQGCCSCNCGFSSSASAGPPTWSTGSPGKTPPQNPPISISQDSLHPGPDCLLEAAGPSVLCCKLLRAHTLHLGQSRALTLLSYMSRESSIYLIDQAGLHIQMRDTLKREMISGPITAPDEVLVEWKLLVNKHPEENGVGGKIHWVCPSVALAIKYLFIDSTP